MDVLGIPSLPGTFYSGLILSEVNQSRSKTCPVGDTREQQFGSLVQFVLKALLSYLQDIGDIGHG